MQPLFLLCSLLTSVCFNFYQHDPGLAHTLINAVGDMYNQITLICMFEHAEFYHLEIIIAFDILYHYPH